MGGGVRLVNVVRVRGSAGDGLLGGWGEGVGEEELGELALAEGDQVWL